MTEENTAASTEETQTQAPAVEAAPAEQEAPKKKGPKVTPSTKKDNLARKTMKAIFRRKLKKKLQAEPEFATKFFEARSKRSADRKVAYRRRHAAK